MPWAGGTGRTLALALNFSGASADLGTGETQLICSEQNTLQGAGCILGAQGGGCSAARQAEMEAWMERDGAGQILLYSAGGPLSPVDEELRTPPAALAQGQNRSRVLCPHSFSK